MAKKTEEPKFAAKQLRLTNEEIVEKFAVYWAEVDSAIKRQQSFDRILEVTIARLAKVEKQIKYMNKVFDCLTLVFAMFVIIVWVLFWIITG